MKQPARIYDLLSDLHLSADTPLGCKTFSVYIETTPAEAVFILGDWFDAWVGPEQAELEPYVDVGKAVLASSRHRKINFMPGNRDFLLSESTLSGWGVTLLPDPFALGVGDPRALLSHGDALCLADKSYQDFRKISRASEWQSDFLTKSFEERLRLAKGLRADSENAKRAKSMAMMDVDRDEALRWLARSGAQCLIHGHTHRPGSDALDATHVRHVLSDWQLDDHGEAPRAEVLRLTCRTGQPMDFTRVSLV
jgi:UDP-2,3-diacylglucosamine hydrolase